MYCIRVLLKNNRYLLDRLRAECKSWEAQGGKESSQCYLSYI